MPASAGSIGNGCGRRRRFARSATVVPAVGFISTVSFIRTVWFIPTAFLSTGLIPTPLVPTVASPRCAHRHTLGSQQLERGGLPSRKQPRRT